MSTNLFIQQILTNYKEIGAVAPSSRYLVDKMLLEAKVHKATTIVEIGAGTGVMTYELLKKAPANARIIIIETNEAFCDQLEKIEDARIKVYNRSAEELKCILTKEGITHVDCIVSSLPLAIIPTDIKKEIIQNIHQVMHDSSLYVQFQYSLKSYTMLQRNFDSTKVKFVLFNLPPAFVYISTKKMIETESV